jgi:hypothetical protein
MEFIGESLQALALRIDFRPDFEREIDPGVTSRFVTSGAYHRVTKYT